MNIPSQPQAVLYLLHPFSIQKINGGISIKVSNKMVNSNNNNSIFHRISSGNFSNVSFTFSDTPIHFGFGLAIVPINNFILSYKYHYKNYYNIKLFIIQY